MKKSTTLVAVSGALALVACAGCPSRPAPALTLATTTSTQDSGLLDVLVPRFRKESGIEVKVIAVGTGQALELGRRGDADVLLVHDPDAEEKFMSAGHGSLRRRVMSNDFVLASPPDDPAGVKGEKSITAAFRRIARRKATFVSRGDESGTHAKEKEIWKRARVEPRGDWYLRAGAGMGTVLRLADEKRAYTLSDRGTFLALRGGLGLAVVCEGDPLLLNPYSVILVNPEEHPHVRRDEGRKFADFLLAPDTQKVIAEYGKDSFGQPLFFPAGR